MYIELSWFLGFNSPIDHSKTTLNEICRVLKKGGTIFMEIESKRL